MSDPTPPSLSFPYPDKPGATHYDGCWQHEGHHNCAVAKVRELEKELQELLDEWNRELRE